MTDSPAIPSLAVAWLKPLPPDYRIPFWRWLLLPASTIMLKRNAGAWVSGTLALNDGAVVFTPGGVVKSKAPAAPAWKLPLEDISDIGLEKALASERIVIRHAGGALRLMAIRSADFVELLREALPAR